MALTTLVPGCRGVVVRRLVDRMIEHVADGNPQELTCNLPAARIRERLSQSGRKCHSFVDFGGARRDSGDQRSGEIDCPLAE